MNLNPIASFFLLVVAVCAGLLGMARQSHSESPIEAYVSFVRDSGMQYADPELRDRDDLLEAVIEDLATYYSLKDNPRRMIRKRIGDYTHSWPIEFFAERITGLILASNVFKDYVLSPVSNFNGYRSATLAALFAARARHLALEKIAREPARFDPERYMNEIEAYIATLERQGVNIAAAIAHVEREGPFADVDLDVGFGATISDKPTPEAVLDAANSWLISNNCSNLKLLETGDPRSALSGLTGLARPVDGRCVYTNALDMEASFHLD